MTLWEKQLALWYPWRLQVKHAMLDQGLDNKDLAEKIGRSTSAVTAALCGHPGSSVIVEKISEYFGIPC